MLGRLKTGAEAISAGAKAAALKPGFDIEATIAESDVHRTDGRIGCTGRGRELRGVEAPNRSNDAAFIGTGILGNMRRRAHKSADVEDSEALEEKRSHVAAIGSRSCAARLPGGRAARRGAQESPAGHAAALGQQPWR